MSAVIKPEPPSASFNVPDLHPEPVDLPRMVEIWEKVFHCSGLASDADFFGVGGHSLTFARLQMLIHKEFGHRIRMEDILLAPTISSLTKRLARNSTSELIARESRITPLRAGGSQPPLFFISQSMVFRRMTEHLGPDQPVFTVQMRDDDLAECGENASFEDIAKFYAGIIRKAHPTGPYCIGGWCVAAWLAYEIAQSLLEEGEKVQLIVVVDAWAPGYWRDIVGLHRILAKMSYYWSRLKLHTRTILTLSPSKSVVFLGERLGFLRTVVAQLTASISHSYDHSQNFGADDQMSVVDQLIHRASLRYRANPTLTTTLLFRSAEQPSGRFLAKDMGWGKLLGRNPKISTLIGDHRQIFNDPGAALLSSEIASTLSRVRAGNGRTTAETQF